MKNASLRRTSFKLTLLVLWILGPASCGSTPAKVPSSVPSTTKSVVAPNSIAAKELKSVDPTADLQVFHYFNDTLGRKTMEAVIQLFQKANPAIKVANNPVEIETFKVAVPTLLQSAEPPDVIAYWPGARVQSAVDANELQPIDDMWAKESLDQVFPEIVAAGSIYNGHKYVIPIGFHTGGFYYNKKLFETIGAKIPQNWAELKAVAVKFKEEGIPTFAVGSRERWPAENWFDFLLLRTAGYVYRNELLAGKHSYTDPEVMRVMQLWKELLDAGYFYPDANAYDWAEAAKLAAESKAVMTLMGQFTMGYYKTMLNLEADKDYGYFTFPTIDKGVKPAEIMVIDGFMMAKKARHPANALKFLAFLTSKEAQETWTIGQGALPPSLKVDRKKYNPIMQRILKSVDEMDPRTLSYKTDVAVKRQISEAGLDIYSEFLARPADYPQILQRFEKQRQEFLKNP